MIHIDLEDKINGTETVSLEELMLGFLEEFQQEASEEKFTDASHWDVMKFFVRYCHEHDYHILKSPIVTSKKKLKMSPEFKARCKRFYYPGWREKIKKEL